MDSIFAVYAVWAVVGYLLGSVSGGVIAARAMHLGNLRDIGSGNIGATNVLRTGNRKAAALTLIFDAVKGAVAVLLANAMANYEAAQIAGIAAFIGHCYPVWLRFRGGKGVATYIGILWALAWPMGAAACLIWLVVAAITRYSSLAALIMAGWMPIVMAFTGYGYLFFPAVLLALLLYWRHRENIGRLRAGAENRIGAK